MKKFVLAVVATMLLSLSSFAATTLKANVTTTVTANGPVNHNITLSWTQSTSPNLVKNSVYRFVGTCASPTFTKLADITPVATTYIDQNVVSGTSYCYTVTATDNVSESNFSLPAVATVPGPAPVTGLSATGN
jgi:hypothetical protein